jgi:hypothetical protein
MKGISLGALWLLCTLAQMLAQNPCNITIDLRKDTKGMTIKSPNYGFDNYPPNLHSCWSKVINSPKNGVIVDIKNFSLHRKENEDCFDYLEIGIKKSRNNLILCGNEDAKVFIIDSNEIELNFVSDESFESKGFNLEVKPIQLFYFKESDTIKSPKLGKFQNYVDNMNITYEIMGSNETLIYMEFESEFAIEKFGNKCVDYLEISSLDAKSDPLKLCGYETPTDIIINSSRVFLRFFSDSFEVDKGFTVKYKQIKWFYTEPNGMIKLEKDTVPITYKIVAPAEHVIEISVENFEFTECHRNSTDSFIASQTMSVCLNGQNDYITVGYFSF